jgi:hypothetical protein
MVCFQTKNNNLGKFWRAIEWKTLVYFMAIWYILWLFGNVVVIWYLFPPFGILCQEKSGNPALTAVSKDRGRSPDVEIDPRGQCYDFHRFSSKILTIFHRTNVMVYFGIK